MVPFRGPDMERRKDFLSFFLQPTNWDPFMGEEQASRLRYKSGDSCVPTFRPSTNAAKSTKRASSPSKINEDGNEGMEGRADAIGVLPRSLPDV